MSGEFAFTPITTLSELIASREASPVDIVQNLLDRIERFDPSLKAYITVLPEEALRAARQAEQEIAAGRLKGPLHGIPIVHKDVTWTAGVPTTANSKALAGFVPEESAFAVERLDEAGMILLGKTTTSEFACGSFGLVGPSVNPWHPDHFTGGSSAGSAGALAAGLAVAATGSDTGGSIRVPSSFCGIAGLKPTFGRVSRRGLLALSWSMDHVGPMARTAADCALLLNAMAGHDPRDPKSSRRPVPDFTAGLGSGIEGRVLGVPSNHYFDGLDPDVERAVKAALQQLEALGARLESVDLPRAADLAAAGTILMTSEAFSQHAERLRTQSAGYTDRARRRIASGAFYTTAEYHQALQIRTLWIEELDAVIEGVDALVTPTLPAPAFRLDEHLNPPDTSWGTRQFSMSGHPAISVPCGFTADGLPVGLQFACSAFEENRLFQIAHAYEQAAGWYRHRPPLIDSRKVDC